jgi:hypothetical protein
MDKPIHLIVDAGPERGREISIPSDGVRIGRSSRNDIVINDPAISRFHCRFFFKHGQGLWVTDLGSANETLLNGAVITEVQAHVGDQVTMGDTVLRVVNDRRPLDVSPVPASPAQPAAAPANGAGPAEPVIDLGLRPDSADPRRLALRRRLLMCLLAMALVAGIAWIPKPKLRAYWRSITQWSARPVGGVARADLPDLDLSYERVQATSANIFRYFMSIQKGMLIVQVDDIANQRHVRREKKLDNPDLIPSLVKTINASGFYELADEYPGQAPGISDTFDLSVTISNRTHRTKVVNHVEPDVFATVRGAIEEFGKNELGLAALAVEPAKLVSMAQEALLQGRKLYDEREIRAGNLAAAISAFKQVEIYLETIEPKPDFYRDAVGRRADGERELQKKYDEAWFLAERAVKLGQWEEAAKQLRVVMEMVPDRADERNQNASKMLIDVERHLTPKK